MLISNLIINLLSLCVIAQHPGRIRRLTGDLHDRSSSIPEEGEEEEDDDDNGDEDIENTDVQSDDDGYVVILPHKTDDVGPVFHNGPYSTVLVELINSKHEYQIYKTETHYY